MKHDYTIKILDMDNKEIPLNVGVDDGKYVTLGNLAVNALIADRRGQTGVSKINNAKLAFKIHNRKTQLDLTSKQISDLVDLIKEVHRPLMALRAIEILDPKSIEE